VALAFTARALAVAGAFDNSFSGDGRVTTAFPGQDGVLGTQGSGLAIQGDGKIIVSGTSFHGPSPSQAEFALARYRPGGSRDPDFGTNGRVLTTFPTTAGSPGDYGRQVALQRDGKIVVVGLSTQSGGLAFALARYRPNGHLDPGFSGDGLKLTRFPGSTTEDRASAGVVQSDGKIMAAGRSRQAGGLRFAIARYLPNGRLDNTFSGDGRLLTHFHGSMGDDAGDLAIGPTGRLVAVGTSFISEGQPTQIAVARYKPDGSLDRSFSSDGRRWISFRGSSNDRGTSVAIQRNGAVLVAGTSVQPGGEQPAIARVRGDGSLDPTFSGDGKRVVHFPYTTNGEFQDIAIQSDGRIVAVGNVQDGNAAYMGFARLRAGGSLDPSFSGDGLKAVGFFGSNASAYHVAIQRDGRIVGAGSSQPKTGPGGFQFAVARLLGS
jgi:uncharacterized delta-60 repeat protein